VRIDYLKEEKFKRQRKKREEKGGRGFTFCDR
jgi:hypothetical protein